MMNTTADHSDTCVSRLDDTTCIPLHAVRQLKVAHRVLRRCFMKLAPDPAAVQFDVVQEICDELVRYLQIKEHIFYPALRQASSLAAFRLHLDQSIVEHFSVQTILETLDGQGPGDPLFTAKVRTLERHVIQHVDDEERRLFPLLGDLPLRHLSRRMAACQHPFMSEAGA